MIGTTIGHYRIQERIGQGGMGEVYLAEDTTLDRQVALKLLPPDLATNEERRNRFEREAKALAALSHPNIVTVHSVEHAGDVHFMTMELVRGRTLEERLAEGRPLALSEFFDVAIPLAGAVAAAHEHGITHRDLKPANIMLTEDGRVKILDFGLAKLDMEVVGLGKNSELETRHKTAEGRILGTVAYMSPEQAEGKSVDHRSDIFSLGIVLYELASGERPFVGDTPASTLSSILKDTPAALSELNASVPRELSRIIRRTLNKDAERRVQSAKDLRNELEGATAGARLGRRP